MDFERVKGRYLKVLRGIGFYHDVNIHQGSMGVPDLVYGEEDAIILVSVGSEVVAENWVWGGLRLKIYVTVSSSHSPPCEVLDVLSKMDKILNGAILLLRVTTADDIREAGESFDRKVLSASNPLQSMYRHAMRKYLQ
jgi:hypothetical protein